MKILWIIMNEVKKLDFCKEKESGKKNYVLLTKIWRAVRVFIYLYFSLKSKSVSKFNVYVQQRHVLEQLKSEIEGVIRRESIFAYTRPSTANWLRLHLDMCEWKCFDNFHDHGLVTKKISQFFFLEFFYNCSKILGGKEIFF